MANFNKSYVGKRSDVLSLIPPTAKKVLDVGCSVGALGSTIKEHFGSEVVGIELMEDMAKEARKCLDKVFVGDVRSVFLSGKLKKNSFDVIVFADVLEHLQDPWEIVRLTKELLQPGGVLVVSLPNIRHISTLCSLIFKGYWPYRDRGIHDRTHLRFFTRRNVKELFKNEDFQIEKIRANYRIIERPHFLNKIAKVFALPVIRGFFAFQYLVRAKME